MGKNRFYSFDRQFAEMNNEKIDIKVFGETHKIFAKAPAIIVLRMARHENSEELSTRDMIDYVSVVYGADVLDQWSKRADFSIEMLGEIVKQTIALQNGENPGEGSQEVSEDDLATGGTNPKK